MTKMGISRFSTIEYNIKKVLFNKVKNTVIANIS